MRDHPGGAPLDPDPFVPGARHIFRVPSEADLPPLSGNAAGGAPSVLERLLEELLDAAGANVIPSPAAAPDGSTIVDAFAGLKAASKHFDVAPGISLADHFWTHAAAFHTGTLGKQLAQTARRGPVQGFLALYATEVSSPLLYSPNLPPFRVQGTIETGSADVGGPYLALIACEGRPDGTAGAMSGFAVPVLHAQRFVPVRSELDRDVLRALEHLQVSLDAHGLDCTLQRIRTHILSAVTMLNVTLSAPGAIPRHFRLVVDPAGETSSASDGDASVDFVVNHRNWSDGGFVAWLEKSLGR